MLCTSTCFWYNSNFNLFCRSLGCSAKCPVTSIRCDTVKSHIVTCTLYQCVSVSAHIDRRTWGSHGPTCMSHTSTTCYTPSASFLSACSTARHC